MALTQISTDGIKNGTITGSDLATNVDLVDDQKLRFGTGNDLQIFHDGTHSRIYNDTATSLNFTSADFTFNSANNSEQLARFTGNGSCEFYFNNSKKFETTSSGVNVTGMIDTTENIDIDADNQALRIGASQNFQLVFTGSEAIIKNIGATSPIKIKVKDGVEDAIVCNANGGVELYYDNSKTFETTSYGNLSAAQVRVASSNATTVGFSLGDVGTGFYNSGSNAIGYSANGTQKWNINSAGDLRLNDSVKLSFGGSNDMNIYHLQGANSYITNTANNLYIQSENGVHIGSIDSNGSNVETSGKFIRNGTVELYYDNEKVFQTTATGIRVDNTNGNGEIRVRGSEGNGAQIYLDADDADDNEDQWRIDVAASDGSFGIQNYGDGAWEKNIECNHGGGVELYYDNSKKFETQTNGITVTGGVYSDGLICGDSEMVELGNSGDLQIYHNGTNAQFDNSTGNLEIRNKGTFSGTRNIFIRAKVDEASVTCKSDGAVELYYANSKKFETNSTGCFVVGSLGVNPTSSGDVDINKEGTGILVRLRTTGTDRGSISSNGSTVAFNTSSSDRSMKKNFEDWTENTLALFKNINPQKFNFLDQEDGTEKEKGFIAQDMFASFPEAYQKNDDNKYMFNPGGMVVYLMKAIQELEAEVAALKAS